ncbi:hypothetical protein B0T14DRAFT_436131 [Immersiella caudata]|uniref:Uncharacterized protein n=1 Tax=Immersiella caudata TaxID=314043 RepID=A0AA39WFQ7_9PEZI|nr:hypothetical protein B0T14DRAFT_436131 [Immersiella caudata]
MIPSLTPRSLTLALLSAPLLTSAAPFESIFSIPGPPNPSAWFENLAVRPNGNILATRGDAPEIWQIDPATRTGSLLVSVSGAFNLTGISQVEIAAQQETYVFASAYIPAPFQVEPGSAKVWTLSFNGASPSVSLLKALPEAGFLNGLAGFDEGRVLIGDTLNEAVYLMDVETGTYTTPLVSMSGVNGVQVAPGYVYWANHNVQTLSRVSVDGDALPTGSAEVLATNQIDDFALDVRGDGTVRKAYVAAMYDNEVVEVVLATGAKTVVADNLSGSGSGLCTSAVFGRRAADRRVLYATVGQGGETVTAGIVAIDLS